MFLHSINLLLKNNARVLSIMSHRKQSRDTVSFKTYLTAEILFLGIDNLYKKHIFLFMISMVAPGDGNLPLSQASRVPPPPPPPGPSLSPLCPPWRNYKWSGKEGCIVLRRMQAYIVYITSSRRTVRLSSLHGLYERFLIRNLNR